MSSLAGRSDRDEHAAAITLDEALSRLARIEQVLGSMMLTNLTQKQQASLTEAWWESRSDVPRDDDLRALALAEFKEFIHVES